MGVTVIAIAVVGGAFIYGGKGSIEGTIIATLITGVNNLLNLLGMSNHSQEVVIALIIIGMVLLIILERKISQPNEL